MKEKQKITYIICSKKLSKRKKTTTKWEEAKELLKEAAKKSKDNTAYLDIRIDSFIKNKPFFIPYAALGKRERDNIKPNPFQTRIYVDDIDKLKKPAIEVKNSLTINETLEKIFPTISNN